MLSLFQCIAGWLTTFVPLLSHTLCTLDTTEAPPLSYLYIILLISSVGLICMVACPIAFTLGCSHPAKSPHVWCDVGRELKTTEILRMHNSFSGGMTVQIADITARLILHNFQNTVLQWWGSFTSSEATILGLIHELEMPLGLTGVFSHGILQGTLMDDSSSGALLWSFEGVHPCRAGVTDKPPFKNGPHDSGTACLYIFDRINSKNVIKTE